MKPCIMFATLIFIGSTALILILSLHCIVACVCYLELISAKPDPLVDLGCLNQSVRCLHFFIDLSLCSILSLSYFVSLTNIHALQYYFTAQKWPFSVLMCR